MKRVLIISNNALSFSLNNGKTLSSLFEGWRGEDLAQVYFNNEAPESEHVSNFFKITGREQFLSRIKNSNFSAGGAVNPLRRTNIGRSILPSNRFVNYAVDLINGRFEALKLYIRDMAFGSGLTKNAKLLQWIDRFGPDCIFLVAGNSCFSIDFASFLSARVNVPIAVYITDDYVVGSKPAGVFGQRYHARLVKRYSDLFISAAKVFFIGESMLHAFQDEFGVKGDTLINCNLIQRTALSQDYHDQNDKIRVVFAGGLHLGRDRSIIAFAKVMNKACAEYKCSLCFDIYSNQQISDSLNKEFSAHGVNYKGGVSWNVLNVELQQADFLLHVESFSESFYKKTMLSLSTKLPEYLSSGVCVIGYGPSSIASIKILKDNGIGIALTGEGKQEINALYEVIKSPHARKLIARKGELFAENNFSPAVIRERLYSSLMEIS